MSETPNPHQFNQQHRLEQKQVVPPSGYEVELHGTQIELPGQPLLTKEEVASTYGFSADVLAIINLPGEAVDGSQDKALGLIDYGEFDPDEAPSLYDSYPSWGKTRSRYSLRALNYTSHDHWVADYPVIPGDTIVGRDAGDVSRDLSIGDDGRGNGSISREHLTITLTPEGDFTIRDRSKNGTRVQLSEAREAEPAERIVANDALRTVGGTALDGSVAPNNSGLGLIDRVPSTGKEAREMMEERKRALNAPKVEMLQRQIDEMEQRWQDIVGSLGEDDQRALWSYAAGLLNQREEQRRGNASAAKAWEREAGKGLRAMSSEGKRHKDEYLRLMTQLDRTRSKLSLLS